MRRTARCGGLATIRGGGFVSDISSPEERDPEDETPGKKRRFWRKPLFFGLGVIVLLGAISGGNMLAASSNGVCASCHEMQQQYQEWHTSGHKNVSCINCHTESGLSSWVTVNLNVFSHGIQHIMDSYDTPITAQVSDNSCLSCHPRDSRPEVIPASTLKIAHSAHNQLRCAQCHGRLVHVSNTTLVAEVPMASSHSPKDCLVCHQISSCPHGSAQVACSSCHSGDIPMHDVAQERGLFPMQSCIDCHTKEKVSSPEACETCHISPHGINLTCSKCHSSTTSWTQVSFVHPVQLVGAHQNLQCVKCHTNGQDFTGLQYKCSNCHTAPHEPRADGDCATCHTPVAWTQLEVQHQKIWAGYQGAHATVSCESCHKNGTYDKLPTNCDACHQRPHQDYGQPCSNCHTNPGVKWM